MKYNKLMILAAAMAMLTGCTGGGTTAFTPTESSLYITSEGTVTSATVETYEESYYSADDLKAYVEEVLTSFNGQTGTDSETPSASIRECTMSDGTAKLLIDFKDADSYLNFMEEYPDEESRIQVTDMDITTVTDGVAKGYLVGKNFTKTSADGKTVASDEVMKQSKLYVAAIEGAALLQTDGAIQYISEGVSVVGANMIQTPEDEVSYVVFK